MISQHAWALILLAAALLLAVPPAGAAPAPVRVGDAFVREDAGGGAWTIGTSAVQMRLERAPGGLRLASLRSRLTTPPSEWIAPGSAAPPFAVGAQSGAGPWAIDTLWSRPLPVGASVDPAADGLRIAVKRGQMLGFSAATSSDDGAAAIAWTNVLEYADGEVHSSSSDTTLDQGPVWFTYIRANGTGWMDPLGETVPGAELSRVPAGYRAPFECSRITPTAFHLTNAFELVRAWRAPRDGVVTIRGAARHAGGGAPARVALLSLAERAAGAPQPPPAPAGGWGVESAATARVAVGGRPAVQLELTLRAGPLRARLRLRAHPRTAILRQWVEIENASGATVAMGAPGPVAMALGAAAAAPATLHWMCGGTSRPNQGQLESAPLTGAYRRALLGDRSDNYVPWMALLGNGPRAAGLFVTLDHLGAWSMALDAASTGAVLSSAMPELAGRELKPGQRVRLPLVTLGVFAGDLDDMGRRVYDWQYEYLWDLTNSDYFARTRWAVPWFFCSRNLQEQFAARVAWLDMDADLMRTMGIEMLWDDAGWSKYPGWPIPDDYSVVFSPSNEGPDYSHTVRYLGKMGMEWIVWFAGRPSPGVMDGKVGAWGDFQWRTDGFGRFGLEADRAIRGQVERFLAANPRSSFHTCDGGSRYAHQFEIQRLADVNYLSDLGRDAKTNHYLSYLDLPDKWTDIIDPLSQGGRYNPDIAWGLLTMAPAWYAQTAEADRDSVRRLMETYRYLRREGLAGRWSYMAHPVVAGDHDYYYDQRTSRDRTKACLIMKHRPPAAVTLYPRGLLPAHAYVIGAGEAVRSGADLMAKGIALAPGAPAGIITLGLPNLPGRPIATPAPTAPGSAIARRETNLGHPGVAVYWSPGADENWISGYEIRRGADVIGRASVGACYFDHSPGWSASAAYAVRTLSGSGRTSGWTVAASVPGEDAYPALGGHFAAAGRDGWSAESSADGRTFQPMRFVPAAKSPAGDLGGTPNQPGGVEGYWEGSAGARVGRGWQLASPGEECVRAWTAPRAGRVRVVGRAMKECYRHAMGAPLPVRILVGDRQVWPTAGPAEVRPGDWTGAVHDLQLDLSAGDVVRFMLGRGQSPEADIVAWMPRLEYAPQPAPEPGGALRILCGGRAPAVDDAGHVWSADRAFVGGRAGAAVGRPAPSWRQGRDFAYSIPVGPGLHSVRLRFVEPKHAWAFERPMTVSINGRAVLEDFDIVHAARGSAAGCERVFRRLLADASGHLVIRFVGGRGPGGAPVPALVSAIEVLPETGAALRINAGAGTPFVDWGSDLWSADRWHSGGETLVSLRPVQHASPTLYDQELYRTARAGHEIRYAIPAAPGHHTVHLKFAELWLREVGKRPMQISINGRPVRESWDPAAAAGQVDMAADLRFPNVTPNSCGQILIRLRAVGPNPAILQAIEIE